MTSPATEIVVTDVQPQHSIPASNHSAAPQFERLTFPGDFPSVPKGVTIISFSAWKERGICIDPRPDDPDELEVDMLGIPTIAMGAHKTDHCKTKTRRKKKKEEAKMKYLANGNTTLPWWVLWEENESVRIAQPTNASDSRLSKFLSAASDFKLGRKWPALVNNQIDPSHLWTMMEVFLGIEGRPKKALRPSRKKVFHDLLEDQDENSDDDMNIDVDGDEDEDMSTVDGKERKAMNFLNDPEKMVKIFLSSYVRAKGIIWSKINLEQTPRLWSFFLEFLLRSRALPRSEAGFRAALEVTKQALIELPLTGVLSGAVPDEFSRGCRECWGPKTESFRTLDLGEGWHAQPQANDEATDGSSVEKDGVPEVVPEPEQTENLASEGAEGGGWGGDGSTAWGVTSDGDSSGWGAGLDILDGDTLDPGSAENPWITSDEERPFLMRLLGPTILPFTHTTGVVEQSLRRITALIPVPTNIPPKLAIPDPIIANPAAVEADLEKAFPKVVLSPWLDWDGGEMPAYSYPRILDTSQGPVVEPPFTAKTDSAATTTPKSHDPGNDTITVLVQPSVFETMVADMCIAGTWVQIVRQPAEAGGSAPGKKKKGKKKAPANFWYIEEVGGVFPSYWTAKSG